MVEARNQESNFIHELQKQQQLRNNLSIMGIPPLRDEFVSSTVMKILNALGCNPVNEDLVTAYRTNGKNSSIIIKLSSFEKKIDILNARAKKTIRVKDIANVEPSLAENIIFVNLHVTPFFGKLLQEGRKLVKEKRFFSCWLASSGACVKLVENGNPVNFRSSEELQRIVDGNQKTVQKSNGKRNIPDHNSPEESTTKNKAKKNRTNAKVHTTK